MPKIQLLIVEDDESMIKNYEISIKDYNREKSIQIIPYIKKNVNDGLQALTEKSYDGAIIDIRLSGEDMEGEGNRILQEIRENLRFPVHVVTGFPQYIEEDLREENIFWKIHNRTDVRNEEIFDEIVRIYNTGILKILGNKGKIEEYLKKIFWRHLAQHFEEIMKYSLNDTERILLRYISTYLIEYMDIDSEDSNYTPPEFYIKPPVRENLFTGDLIKKKGAEEMMVILTPPCDMIIRKNGRNAEKFLCASVRKWSEVNSDFKKITRRTSKNNKKRAKLVNHMENNKGRYHFLPPYRELPASFIDFQSVSSLTEKEINDNYERIATISRVFMRDIIARFSRYYGRQGQPILDIEKILEEILPDDDST